jgi:hypothetical protein
LALKKEGRCLSGEYINNSTHMLWECKKGHQWFATFNCIKDKGSWCPFCSGNAKQTIEECKEMAKSKNGKCLETEYINEKIRMRWECEAGHQWKTTFDDIKNGNHWCPYCSHCAKHTIEECRQVAESRNGRCLEAEYTNIHTSMRWSCKEGHEWITSFHSIANGSWCPYCAHCIKLTIEECHQVADNRKGKCLETEYINNQTFMRWICEKGHEWLAKFNSIKNGHWCQVCAVNTPTIEVCQEIAKSRGGECLETGKINSTNPILWRCKKGHEWKAAVSDIKKGRWCPYCSRQVSKQQKEIHAYLQHQFQNENIILNDTETIEPKDLDIYIPRLKIGIEFDGDYWHYSERAIKHGALEAMEKKNKKCKEMEIDLLRIREKDWNEDKERELLRITELVSYRLK